MRIAFLGNFGVNYSSESHHAASLEALGHTVARIQEPAPSGDAVLAAAEGCELFVWIHTHGWHTPGIEKALAGFRERGVPTMTYHLDLWFGLRRQRDMEDDPYWSIDHFFTVDRQMATWLTENTAVRGHYLTAAVFGPECYMAQPGDRFDVTFVGSKGYHPEWPYRPTVINWLASNYGARFRHYGGGGLGTVRGAALNQVYADARVTVGDSLCLNFDYPDYWSDRVYETLGRGGFLIHPYVKGMERHFVDGEHLHFYPYGDFAELRKLIDHYIAHPDEADAIRRAGHEHVKANHTYTHRWQTILKALA